MPTTSTTSPEFDDAVNHLVNLRDTEYEHLRGLVEREVYPAVLQSALDAVADYVRSEGLASGTIRACAAGRLLHRTADHVIAHRENAARDRAAQRSRHATEAAELCQGCRNGDGCYRDERDTQRCATGADIRRAADRIAHLADSVHDDPARNRTLLHLLNDEVTTLLAWTDRR